MKQSLYLLLFFILCTVFEVKSEASYLQYEKFNLIGGTMLFDMEDSVLKEHYKHVMKKQMFGWKTYEIQSRLPVTYIKHTLFSYYNDGFTPIKYAYQASYDTSQTFQINATGNIGIDMKDDAKSYKNKLDASLKISADYKKVTTTKTSIDIKIDVDPKTQVDLYIYGEGYLTNGVAARYFMFFRANLGGYEIFESTTEYQRLEKVRI
jgi:hypothetical protein